MENNVLSELFAGSWYEKKEFGDSDTGIITLYHNPPGFDEKELNTKEIMNFFESCQKYCQVIENYKHYTIKNFLYETQKTLVEYYYRGFFVPETCGSNNKSEKYEEYRKHDVNKFFEMLNCLSTYLDKHDVYWSNFDPYPDEKEIEPYEQSLANDLAEIYEDIKSNIDAFYNGTFYDKQQVLWQCKFDWQWHTGEHWTFAVRAIHWKLQDLEYDE